MALIDSIIVFLIGLLIGGIGIYAGGLLITGKKDFSYAVITALIGALIWSITGFFLGGIPVLGPILVLLAWIWIIKARYPGGWINAALIGLVAWATVFIVLSILAAAGIGDFGAIGVPV